MGPFVRHLSIVSGLINTTESHENCVISTYEFADMACHRKGLICMGTFQQRVQPTRKKAE